MLVVKRPTISARSIFESCCEGVQDAERKARLLLNTEKVESSADEYGAAGEAGAIHELEKLDYQPLGAATADDFVWIYNERLVDRAAGRVCYEVLRDGNRNGRCALCNVGRAWTLDHYLPKRAYPVLAVTPDNLLPACRDCNSTKLQNQTPILNLYFDDLGPGPWLKLEVVPTAPWTPKFSVEVQANWSSDLATRAQEHFKLLKLHELYAYQADAQVAGISHRLARLLASQGMEGVRTHLDGEAESWRKRDPNSWRAALYTGLAASEWFCSGGFAAE